ncbi:uncharacterized protein LOC103569766 [Microplitis demolitor]|uniref:uncharacterized protein LOC103569766 n=1 Tax=Microplitis demolitor TaxID=69319 RepID=UPI0004CDD6A1|nr:uncharacterized protein LOC103569766 [Microplitis demolitor]XP_008545463.1 uncharacterized protein LOC103569766 [Microplitis demolitor]
MGNSKSRCTKMFASKSDDDHTSVSSVESRDPPFSTDINDGWTADHELELLRRTIEQDPEIFILNNLMMSIQFFENYDEEIASIRQTLVSSLEEEFNTCLPAQKHVLIPDVLQERLARKVDFTYVGPSMIPSVESLQPIRVFVVHDNIEVSEQSFASPYCSVNETVTYSMQLKPSKHKGYALLQRLEVNPSRRKTQRASVNVIYSDGDSYYNGSKTSPDNNSLSADRDKKSNGSGSSNLTASSSNLNYEDSAYDERDNFNFSTGKFKKEQNRKQINDRGDARTRQTRDKLFNGAASSAESTSSGYKSSNYAIDSDSDGSYAISTVGDVKVDSETERPVFSPEIPRECFEIYDPRTTRVQKNLNSKDRKIRGIIHSRKYDVWYLNSRKFMDHFYELFTNGLSDLMGFDADEDEDGPLGAVIYRDKIEPLESLIGTKDDQFAIIPCIWLPWPEIADEWLDRPRTTWPDYDVIERVKEIGCYIIPEGYAEENGNNSLKNLEWELTFPAAERYLETCMGYSQARVYFMALVLKKTFIRPIDSFVGLTANHIRHHMFWMIEELDTPSKWMENRMGECLMTFLGTLYHSISQDEPIMQDYFIKEKNIFPAKKYLLRTQKQLKRIIENPVMYFIHAMQNIKHSRSFFPKLDYATLLRILTDDILMLINPHLGGTRTIKSQSKSIESLEKIYEPTGGFWDSAKHEKEKRRVRKMVTSKNLVDTKTSYDQILEIPVKCAEMEPQRLCLLLDLFIRHFIRIAECCHKYRSLSQKTVYIEHSERLCMILSKYDSYKDDAKAYLDRLHALKRRVASTKPQSDPPETPIRNSDRSIFSASLNNRFHHPVESQTSAPLPSIGESVDYTRENFKAKSSNEGPHELESPPARKHVTMAVVHEVQSSSSSSTEAIELQQMGNSNENSEKNNKPRSVSLNADKNLQEETTYI